MGIFEETQKEVSEVKKIVEELKALSEKGLSQIETDDPKSIDDIEIMTGFAKPTLYGYVRKNIIPYHKINQRLEFGLNRVGIGPTLKLRPIQIHYCLIRENLRDNGE